MNREQQIRRYGQELSSTLGRLLGMVSSEPLHLPRSLYLEATIAEYDDPFAPDRVSRSLGRPAADELHALPAVREDRFLAECLKEPLLGTRLLLGPVGSGKSCLVESLALSLAKQLLVWKDTPNACLPFVPFIVPLRLVRDDLLGFLREGAGSLFSQHSQSAPRCLSNRLFEQLIADGKAVCLLDGFDEVPPAHARQIAVQITRLAEKTVVLLTSRPGHGAEDIVGQGSQRHTIEPLAHADLRVYAQRYFANFRGADEPTVEKAVNCLEEVMTGRLSEATRRPLFLKAWCDHWWTRRASARTYGELFWRQFSGCLDQRGIPSVSGSRVRAPSDPHEELLEAFSHWLGEIGCQFADRDFADISRDEPVTRKILASGKVRHDGESGLCFDALAVSAGFLAYEPEGRRLSLFKVPVVEYLIGRWLALRSLEGEEGKQEVIDVFRRWVWRPSHHDLLDHFFEALWHGSEEQRSLASALLAWIAAVEHADPLLDGRPAETVSSDLLYPFSLTALRWHALDGVEAPEGEEAALNVARHFPIAAAAIGRFGTGSMPFSGPPLSAAVLSTLVLESMRFLERFRRSGEFPGITSVRGLALRARPADVPYLFREWLTVLKEMGDQQPIDGIPAFRAMNLLGVALVELVENLLEKDVPNLLAQLMPLPDVIEQDWFWSATLLAIGRRITGCRAAGLLQLQISRLRAIPEADRPYWFCFVEGVCAALGEKEAREFLDAAIEQHDQMCRMKGSGPAAQNSFEVLLWRSAIECAARRLNARDTRVLVLDYLKGGRAQRPWEKLARLAAMSGASQQLPEEEALGVVTALLDQRVKPISPLEQEYCDVAAAGAATRLRETDVASAIQYVCTTRAACGFIDKTSFELMGIAARRAGEEEAERLMEWCVNAHREAPNGDGGLDWRHVITQAAGRVSERRAATLMRTWLKTNDEGDKHELKARRRALKGLAKRVRPESAFFLVQLTFAGKHRWPKDVFKIVRHLAKRLAPSDARRLVEEWLDRAKTTSDARMKDAYFHLIERASTRIAESDAFDVCKLLLDQRMHQAALRLAWRSGNVGIKSQVSGDGKEVRLAPFIRSGMVLDEELRWAPQMIREVEGRNVVLSPNQILLLETLASAADRARKSRDERAAWLSMTPWFTAAGITRQRVDHQELIASLIRLGFAQARTAGKWSLYRITSAGSVYLSPRQ